jgi:penicillin-binding protein 1C
VKEKIKGFLNKTWSRKQKLLLASLLVLGVWFYISLPSPLFNAEYSTIVYDANDQLINTRIAKDGQWRFPHSDSLPFKFQASILEFEDRYFFYHPGINIVSLTKAFLFNLKKKENKSGASTITMQLARIARGNRNRTYWEKTIEILLALRIECSFSKKEILNYYANHAPYGGNIIGLNTASWKYFGRDPSKLSWAESALLAVLPNAPSLIYPGKNQTKLVQKRNRLLGRLYTSGVITESTYKLALQEKLPTKPKSLPQFAPHLLQRLVSESGEGKLYRTTVSENLQNITNDLLQKHMKGLKGNGIHNACALVIETKTGRVLAYVGNSKQGLTSEQNDVDVISAPRSSGSILKPLLYALLINDGLMAPHALIEDVPMQIGSYAPKNYNLTYDGLVPASEALTRSLNVPAVKMLQMYGVPSFLYQLKKFGFTTMNKPATHYGLSLILGGAEVNAWDVAKIYSGLGRTLMHSKNKKHNTSVGIFEPILLRDDKSNATSPPVESALSAASIWTTFNAMTELARPEDYAQSSSFSSVSRIAWKTGTSFGYRDAWAVGLNKKYTIVVWVGNADGEGRPGLTGINVAAPLMFSIFNAFPNNEWFFAPGEELLPIKTCEESGFRLSESCPQTKVIQAPRSVMKSSACTFHKTVNVDSSGRYQVNGLCYPVKDMKQKPYLVLTPLQEFFYKQKHLEFISRPPLMLNCLDESNLASFDIVYPREGYKIYLPFNERNTKNELILSATHCRANATLYWYVDKEFIGITNRFHQMAILPTKGKHQLEVVEEHGKSIRLNFEIIDK